MTVPADLEVPLKPIPHALIQYQQEWVADQSPLKVEEKSRRTGLTWAEAADDVLIASSERSAGGMNVYYLAYNKDMTVEFIQACAMWAKAFDYAASEIEEGLWDDGDDKAPEDRYIKTYVIRFPNSGFRIEALSSRPSNLRGRQGVVVIDEAAFHEQLDELLKAALAFLIWGGKVRVISTHNGEENPFNELVQEIRAGKRAGTIHRIDFKTAVSQGLYRRVCLRKGIEWKAEEEAAWMADIYKFYGSGAAEELDCIPSSGGGTWLTHALLEKRSAPGIPIRRWASPRDFIKWTEDAREKEVEDWLREQVLPVLESFDKKLTSYYGMDFGRSGDLSVIWVLLQEQDLRRRTGLVIELGNMPFNQQKQALFYVVDRLPRFRGGKNDARGNGQYIAEQAVIKYGECIEAVMLTETWYRENTPAFKADLEDGTLYDMPRDQDIIDDHRAFRMVKGVARIPEIRTTGANGQKRHGDSGVAHLLAHAASRNPAAPIEFTAAGRQPESGSPDIDDDDIDPVHFQLGGLW